MGALSVTHQKKYQAPFEPLVPGCVEAEFNNIESIEKLVTEKTCGVIVEPIQGEGGIMPAQEEWLRALRKRCDEVHAVLIYDEIQVSSGCHRGVLSVYWLVAGFIQCGLGRTGKLWAHSYFPKDCHPDIITMAKPLANGIPIGAIMMKDKIADIIKIGDHGTTFGWV
jgi:acetylornithine aminotransferase